VVVEAYGSGSGAAIPAGPAAFSVQAGSFLVRDNAEELRDALGGEYERVKVVGFQDARNTYYRVRVGRYSSERAAREAAQRLVSEGYSAFVVRVE